MIYYKIYYTLVDFY